MEYKNNLTSLIIDGIWHITLQWLAGDFMCRLMNMLKQFSLYISSSIIMVKRIVILRHFTLRICIRASLRKNYLHWLQNSTPMCIAFQFWNGRF